MGDLHSIACHSSLQSSSSLGWNFHNLGVFNADMSHFMESTPPFFSSSQQVEADDFSSTGYLQDALFEFSTKRRRLHFCNDDDTKELTEYSNCNDSKLSLNYFENYDYLSQIMMSKGEPISSGEPMSGTSEETSSLLAEMKTSDVEEISTNYYYYSSETFDTFSSSSSHNKDSVNSRRHHHQHSPPRRRTSTSADDKETLPSSSSVDPIFPSENSGEKRKKRSTVGGCSNNNYKVVYPFAVVKPGGKEGDVTLNDINERILMPPTRPVRHPVGDYACRPLVSGPDGPGLSGKAVVALTRIHTKGRGTITIIRTRG